MFIQIGKDIPIAKSENLTVTDNVHPRDKINKDGLCAEGLVP